MKTTQIRNSRVSVFNTCPVSSANRQHSQFQPVSENVDPSTVIALLEDEHARTILTATSVEPLSKSELAERCDVSLPTISRRIEQLETAELVREQTRARPDGHHDTVYVAQLDRFEVRLHDGELEYELTRMDRDMTDELERLWRKF